MAETIVSKVQGWGGGGGGVDTPPASPWNGRRGVKK